MSFRDISGFGLVELLIVVAIIGIIGSVVMGSLGSAKGSAYFVRTQKELRTMHEALQMYVDDYGSYPADEDRDVPAGLEEYISTASWPDAPWPDSVYDWDNWTNPDTGEPILQVSVRFCPAGGALEECNFPDEDWVTGFDQWSSAYYCIEGACRAHIDRPESHPGYCMNC